MRSRVKKMGIICGIPGDMNGIAAITDGLAGMNRLPGRLGRLAIHSDAAESDCLTQFPL